MYSGRILLSLYFWKFFVMLMVEFLIEWVFLCYVLLFCVSFYYLFFFFFFQAEDGIRDLTVTGVQTCALPISRCRSPSPRDRRRPSSRRAPAARRAARPSRSGTRRSRPWDPSTGRTATPGKIGRASCRERV